MNDRKFFQGKVVVITGASSGIGREAALFFARWRAKVVLAARNREKLAAVQEEIRRLGGEALALETDVCSLAGTQRMAAETVLKWGQIDVLIASAGEYVRDHSGEIDIGSIERSMAVNFMGTVHAVKSVLAEMRRAGQGHVVIMNSLDAKKGIVHDGPYVAAKAALDGFGDVLRQELKAEGIRVTSVYPARVDTPMLGKIKVPWISPKMAPARVVKAMAKGIRKNRAVVVVPGSFFLLGPLNCMLPRLADWAYRILKIEGEKIADTGWVESGTNGKRDEA